MEDYIGKICPFCKTEIKEGDAVKVCPSCGIPHHEVCWEENKGCTTFGCSEQHYEEQYTNPTDVCENCGAPLGDGQEFCPKCGTPKGGKKKNICSKCGAELDDGQIFCPKCGQKIDLEIDGGVNAAISQFNAGITKTNEKNKKRMLKIAIIAVAVVVVAVLAVVLVPKIFVSIDDLCAQGNYEKAYAKANDEEKFEIRAENAAAVQSSFSAENLKDPSSFELREVFYNEGTNDDGETTKQLVLYISGANSYGAKVSSYWLYVWDNDEDDWSYFCSVSDLEEEEYSSYDDEDEKLEKLFNNLGRASIEKTMDNGIKLSKDAVKRINAMFEADTLDDVTLLDVD